MEMRDGVQFSRVPFGEVTCWSGFLWILAEQLGAALGRYAQAGE
jgi:hypothetical protein